MELELESGAKPMEKGGEVQESNIEVHGLDTSRDETKNTSEESLWRWCT